MATVTSGKLRCTSCFILTKVITFTLKMANWRLSGGIVAVIGVLPWVQVTDKKKSQITRLLPGTGTTFVWNWIFPDDIVGIYIYFFFNTFVCPSYQYDNLIEDRVAAEMSVTSENKVTFAHFLEGIYSYTNWVSLYWSRLLCQQYSDSFNYELQPAKQVILRQGTLLRRI